jgi:16S rRNA (guanine527-N7)-methyltransferase
VPFEKELQQVLPADLPRRDFVIAKAAEHLTLIEGTNHQFNLTRITSPREAAIKHILDSVMPWELFAEAKHVLDAGTGAGFPGIPLALLLPSVRFTLAESIQKKARFVESTVETLDLQNVDVSIQRAEELLRQSRADIITARALAPISRALQLFGPAVRAGARVLLYKGPDAGREIADSEGEAAKRRVRMRLIMRYDLPEDLGVRTIVELSS